jgi:hypothetical protein
MIDADFVLCDIVFLFFHDVRILTWLILYQCIGYIILKCMQFFKCSLIDMFYISRLYHQI